jgi:predicted DNA binding CopG/RHH family protein
VAEHFTEATLRTDTTNEILVSTSIRLPQSLMDQVRAQASQLGIPATTLIRQWITEWVSTATTAAVVSVADLQRSIAARAYPQPS